MNDDARFQDLTRRLAEAEQTLRAIFSGQADAVVYPVSGTPLLLHQAQEALLESEARYRGLVTHMSALVFEATPDGTLVFVNEALTPITGYRPGEMLGQNWRNLVILPNQLSAALELLSRLKVGDVTGYELTLRAKDGSPVTLELSSANRYAADGTLQRIVGLGIDRTRHKRAEQQRDQALHELGERVNELTVLQHASRLLQDHTQSIAELLQELVELLPPAYQYPEITSARIVLDDQEFATPNHAPSPWVLWANLGQRGIIEVCCLEERPAQAEGPFLAEERALLNTLAEMLQAHLERRQVEEERAASEIRFRTLTETTSAAIFIVEGLRVLFANDAAHDMTGYSCDELVTMELWQFAHPTYQDLIRQNGLKQPWGEAIPNRFELRVLTKEGEDRWWDVTTGSLEYEGKPAFVVTAFDITERDRAEKALRKAKQDLEVRVAERTAELRETVEQLQTANTQLHEQAAELEVAGEELTAQNDELRAAQQSLEMERLRYQELFDFAPGGYLVTDLNETIREANRAAASMLGVSAKRLEGKPLAVYVSEPEHSTLYARLAELQRTQTAQTWEMRLAPRQGESFPVLVDVAPARDARGQLVGLRWLLRDITERKRAEEEIANLAKFPTENPNPILRLSRDGLILYANEASAPVLREWGCATGEYVPADWRDLTSQALASQSNRTVDVECSERVYSFSIAPIVERGYVNLYGRDITERKRAEEALHQSEERFRLVLQNAPLVVANLDRELAYTWIYNPKGGFRSEQVLGKPVGLSTDPERTERIVQSLRQVLADGTPAKWEAAAQTPTGEMFFESHAEALRNVGGEITGVALVSIDITERRRAEELTQHHAEELRAMNEELTRFNNAMVGRELRMIELKQEVNELCGRAGLPQRYALDVQQEGP